MKYSSAEEINASVKADNERAREREKDPELEYLRKKEKEAVINAAIHDAKKMSHTHSSVIAIYHALKDINKFPRIVAALLTIAIMLKSNER